VWNSNNSVKNNIHFGRRSPKCWSPRLQPIEPIGKSGTAWFDRGYINRSSIHRSWKVKTCETQINLKWWVKIVYILWYIGLQIYCEKGLDNLNFVCTFTGTFVIIHQIICLAFGSWLFICLLFLERERNFRAWVVVV
jgi:hypothetical protein